MTGPTCLTCVHRKGTGGGLKECLSPLKNPGLATWIVNCWTGDDKTQDPPCPYHMEATVPETNDRPKFPEAPPKPGVLLETQPDGSYVAEDPGANSKSEALDRVKALGKIIGIPPWAWRKDHVYPNGDARKEPTTYRYKTGTPADLERQWLALVREGVLPQDTPRPLILDRVAPKRKLRTEPPDCILRKLDEGDQARLKVIWPGYIAKETDEDMGLRTGMGSWSGISATTVRRLRQKAGLPSMRSGSGVKDDSHFPEVCYELESESQPAQPAQPGPTPPTEAPVFIVDDHIRELLDILGITYPPGHVSWFQVFTDLKQEVRELQTRASLSGRKDQKELIQRLEQKISNQKVELKRLAQKPYPKIAKVLVYEGRVARNVTLVFKDETSANLSVPHATTLPVIVAALRKAGWSEVPPSVEFQTISSGQYQYPPERILQVIDMTKVDPDKYNLGLPLLPKDSYYKVNDPFTYKAMRRTFHNYVLPVKTRGVDPRVEWVLPSEVCGRKLQWGA